jgi:Raf kinase inhibitor-like YbhB/YbcL family protein
MPLSLLSPAFPPAGPIPRLYTCDGAGHSPPLRWDGAPDGARTFALIMDDPDAPGGTWTHWVVYNLPAAARSLPERMPAHAELADGSRQGKNSWGRTG